MPVQTYRDPIAWQKAMDLAELVYRATQTFPKEEMYGLTSQLRRASISISSNIAEGQGRQSTGEFRQFLGHARGSLLEVESQVLRAQRLGYLSAPASEKIVADLCRSRTDTQWSHRLASKFAWTRFCLTTNH